MSRPDPALQAGIQIIREEEMRFFRAAFARVFFGVSNTLSVIMRSLLHAITTTLFRVKHALCLDLTPRFLTPRFLLMQDLPLYIVPHLLRQALASAKQHSLTVKFSTDYLGRSPTLITIDYLKHALGKSAHALKNGLYILFGYFCVMAYAYAGAPITGWWAAYFVGLATVPFPPLSTGFSSDPVQACLIWEPYVKSNRPDIYFLYYTGMPYKACAYGNAAYGEVGDVVLYQANYCPTEDRIVTATDDCPAPAFSPKNLGRPDFCPVGNPINQGTGKKFQIESDYVGSGRFPLMLQRYHNGDIQRKITAWGANWQTDFSRSIVATASAATIYRPDGKTFNFTLSGGTWISDADITDQLQQTASGWTYTSGDNSVETYSTSGQLLSIATRTGLTQRLTYSDGTNGSVSGNGGYVLDATGNATTVILPAGLLIRVTDPSGRALNFGYDVFSRLVKMTDPAGRVYLYGYDRDFNITSVTYHDNYKRIYLYEHYSAYTGINTSNQSYLASMFTGIIDTTASDATGASGTRYASYWYDSGRAYKEEHAPTSDPLLDPHIDQYQLNYNTDTSGNPQTVVTDPRGSVRTYHFTTVLGVVKSTGTDQPGGSGYGAASSNISYDTNGNVSSRADFNGHKTCYAYDNQGRNLETARVEGLNYSDDCATALAASTLSGVARKTTTVWDTTYRLPHIITEAVGKPEERVTTINYDPTSGNVLSQSIKDTASGKTRTWTYSYTTAADNTLVNLLKTVDGPRTDVADITTYTYYTADDSATPIKYRRGDLWKITNALTQTTTITAYDGNGRPLTIVDPNAVTTTLAYTPRGWLKSRTIGSKTTLYNYDNVGNLTKVTLGDGSFIQYTYDAAHRMTDISDILLNRIHYTLDAIGNRVKEEVYDSNNKLSTVKARDFDPLNRLWHDIAYFNDPNTPVATQYSYDANGNLTTVTPPANNSTDTTYRTTTFSYDALNRLSYIFDPINTTVHPTTYTYNALDQLQSVTDPRQLINSYTTNALGSTTVQTSPDKGTINRTVDEAGNVKTETYANSTQASYTYDALNRLITASFPTLGENITLTWDSATGCTYGIGQLCQITDAGGSMTFAYDDQGNRIKETRLISGASFVTQYSFDGANRPGVQTLPSSRTATLARNTAGQINGMTSASGATNTTVEQQITYTAPGR
jgi:YD repeat-containing protein